MPKEERLQCLIKYKSAVKDNYS